jgi:hypothetical protein
MSRRYNHTDKVLDLEGNEIPDNAQAKPPAPGQPASTPPALTMRALAMMALNQTPPNAPAEKKARVFTLSTKFYRGKYAKLSVDEAALLKELGGNTLNAMAYGRLCEWLEGTPQFVETEDDEPEDDDEPVVKAAEEAVAGVDSGEKSN